jgi:hypothetical protein
MCAQATITDGTPPHRFRCAEIILLAISVFALGLHAKLALYKPYPPSMLVTLTKLALNERSNIAPSPLARQASPDIKVGTSRPIHFDLSSWSIPAQAQRESRDEDGLCAARHHLKPLLLHKPPPAASRAQNAVLKHGYKNAAMSFGCSD